MSRTLRNYLVCDDDLVVSQESTSDAELLAESGVDVDIVDVSATIVTAPEAPATPDVPAVEPDVAVEDAVTLSEPLPDPTPNVYTPLSELRLEELKSAIPHPEALLDLSIVKSRIRNVTFHHLTDSDGCHRATICTVVLDNGFPIEGRFPGWIDDRNHNRELGEHYAYQDAIKNLIPIACYLTYQSRYDAAQAG